VLIKHKGRYHWPVYNPTTGHLEPKTDVQALDLIACTEDTETALVDLDEVDRLSDVCIRVWCGQHGADAGDVVRICALYLKPERDGDSVREWLTGEQSM
jgi:hypothetical protein